MACSLQTHTLSHLAAGYQRKCCDMCPAQICIGFVFNQFILPADLIDIVKDYIAPHEYLAEEDPKLYQSLKTKRGPLSEDWIEEINQSQTPVMCAYKLCKVEFRYWGMQSKIERFIHDVGRCSVAEGVFLSESVCVSLSCYSLEKNKANVSPCLSSSLWVRS